MSALSSERRCCGTVDRNHTEGMSKNFKIILRELLPDDEIYIESEASRGCMIFPILCDAVLKPYLGFYAGVNWRQKEFNKEIFNARQIEFLGSTMLQTVGSMLIL